MYFEVCNGFRKLKNQQTTWWLDALNQIEQNKDMSNELIRKIREAVADTLNTSSTSRIPSRLVTLFNSLLDSVMMLFSF